MQKTFIFVLVILAVMLSACSPGHGDVYTVEKGGKEYEIDTINHTITYHGTTYPYKKSGNSYTFTFPNQVTYTWSWNGNTSSGSSSSNSDYNWVDSMTALDLAEAFRESGSSNESSKSILWIIIIGGVGIWNVASPYTSWYLAYGWRYKDAEPSDAALVMERIGGVVLIFIAIIYAFG